MHRQCLDGPMTPSTVLMHQFDTLPRQCRHIEHMHEGFWFKKKYYCQNDSYENLDNFLAFIE